MITGGNIGLGQTTAEEAAKAGAKYIVILCRNTRTAAEAEKSIANVATHPNFRIKTIACNLGSLESVRQCVTELANAKETFDHLILNAGVMMVEQGKTQDGFETHIGINHYGHFLLTNLILKANLLKENARVVALSSMAHSTWSKGFDITDLNFERRQYGKGNAYAASKTANILMMQELQRKFTVEGKGRIAVSVHPGFVRTKVLREESIAKYALLAIYPLYWSVSLSPEEGVQCTLHALTSSEVEKQGGAYYQNLKVVQPTGTSSALAAQLWQISAEKTGFKE